ncbi:hydrolase [Afifella sp. IM 167]|uniref:hydrolase n=1 Tax=Afifella sp. IM 167 TaxID=2033586 RepID=UPI001CCD5044|nr:hydrolase [Afifella sp. IM 167]MBZ8133338.1 hydrolase [Afifella sp. IM 167]
MPELSPETACLVLIDLQEGIVSRPAEPRPAAEVVATGKALAARFRAAGAPVVLVRVVFAPDFSDAPPGRTDQPIPRPEGGLPAGFGTLVEGLEHPGDLVVTKRNWGAFYGTDLDMLLRRRGIRSVVVGGIATNFGVESTVRQAWERGYDVLVAEDACAGPAADMHEMAMTRIFPRLCRVTTSAEIAFA